MRGDADGEEDGVGDREGASELGRVRAYLWVSRAVMLLQPRPTWKIAPERCALRSPRSAFTLIELMIVVTIIGFLSAIVLPILARMRQEARAGVRPETPISQAPPTAIALVAEGQPPARSPSVESTDVRVHLRTEHVIEEYSVLTRYTADFAGTFVIRNVDPQADQVLLRFPFPAGMTEARNVSLAFRDTPERVEEAGATTYATTGIEWRGKLPPGESRTVVVEYSAQGRETFVYFVGAGERSGSVHVEIELEGAHGGAVPADSLQPTSIEERRLAWNASRLVTNRPIQVNLPGTESPLGRIILLCQLAGVAVFLFGGGFWYLNEARRPGGLDDFRLGHFLLLALNYSLFFAIFAVVGYDRGPVPAAVAAVALGLPLFTVHVARITEWRFALTRILPLATLTLGTVAAAVYLPERRAYLFLGFAVLVLGYLTMTYRGWSVQRKAHAEEAAARAKREAEERRKGPVPLREGHGPAVALASHCAACGLGAQGAGRFCTACGTPLPAQSTCGRCGEVLVLPTHLLQERWRSSRLCCPGCGADLEV